MSGLNKPLFIALQYRPYYGKAYFNLGRAYMELQEPEKAYEAFRKACMEADLDNEAGFWHMQKVVLYLKKYTEAIFCMPEGVRMQFYEL